jgi:hypothetical protein
LDGYCVWVVRVVGFFDEGKALVVLEAGDVRLPVFKADADGSVELIGEVLLPLATMEENVGRNGLVLGSGSGLMSLLM